MGKVFIAILLLVTVGYCYCTGPSDSSDDCKQKGLYAPKSSPTWKPSPYNPIPQPMWTAPKPTPQPIYSPPKPHPMENSIFTTIGLAQQHRMKNWDPSPPSFSSINGIGAARQAFDMWNHDHSKKWGIR